MPETPTTAAAVVNTPVKSGLLTTELWLKVAALGAVSALLVDLPNLIAQLQAIPNLPPWTAPAFMVVAAVGAYMAPKVAIAYAQNRTQLKMAQTLPATPDAAAKALS
jgi:hypothetical protein